MRDEIVLLQFGYIPYPTPLGGAAFRVADVVIGTCCRQFFPLKFQKGK